MKTYAHVVVCFVALIIISPIAYGSNISVVDGLAS